jgi:N-acetylneuraminate synthase
LVFFSTAFDATAVDFLEELSVPVHKVASFELVDIPLIRKMARTGKPVILSTGMATVAEVREAVETVRAEGNENILLLKCTSAYPADLSAMNLRTIPDLRAQFGLPVGLSDHSLGDVAALTAVALGASLIEKHLTLARRDGGPDSGFSLEPDEMATLVRRVREAEACLGGVNYGGGHQEKDSLSFRRSLYVAEDMQEGEVFTAKTVRSVRPAFGLHTRHLNAVLGRRATRAITKGTPLAWDLVEGGAQ